jgi:hypothetical protein
MSAAKSAAETTYKDVERMINSLCHCFAKTYGFEFDDLKSIANIAFATAYRNYDNRRKATFVTHLWHRVQSALMDYKRREDRQRARLPMRQVSNRVFNAKRVESNSSFLIDFTDNLSKDAKLVVWLVLHMPRKVERQVDRTNCRRASVFRNALRCYLKDSNWTARRITRAFVEVSEVLSR